MYLTPEWQTRAKRKAEEVLTEFWQSNPMVAPVPIQEVIESYVGDVHFVTSMDEGVFDEGISGFARKDMDIGWVIAINGREAPVRQRFSSAHELGHIVLMPTPRKIEYCSDDKSSWVEKACDLFAGYILMPEEFIKVFYQMDSMPYLEDVAKAFHVSRQVAEIQLRLLGLPFRSRVGEASISF